MNFKHFGTFVFWTPLMLMYVSKLNINKNSEIYLKMLWWIEVLIGASQRGFHHWPRKYALIFCFVHILSENLLHLWRWVELMLVPHDIESNEKNSECFYQSLVTLVTLKYCNFSMWCERVWMNVAQGFAPFIDMKY